MHLKVDLLSQERTLLGINYELLNFVDSLDENKKPIVSQYHVITIGFIFIYFELSIRRSSAIES